MEHRKFVSMIRTSDALPSKKNESVAKDLEIEKSTFVSETTLDISDY